MLASKRVAILGFGKEGIATANYLGEKNSVSIFDQKPQNEIEREYFESLKIKNVNFYFGGELPEKIQFDRVIRSPGVRPDSYLVKKLCSGGVILTSPMEIFFEDCPCEIIGVTGTKGKGTTATLIYKLLKKRTKNVFLAGNIGTPAVQILSKLKKDSLVVLELSSFQLIDLKKSPHVAVVLMITREHLDWHLTEEEYQSSKQSIVAYQKKTDFAIINRDFEVSSAFAKKTPAKVFFFSTIVPTNGMYLKNGKIISKISGHEEILTSDKILLRGKHNLQNVLAAISVAKIYKIQNQDIVKVVSSFGGLAHRLQYLGRIKGVSFYNDSYSTIPETTIAAIEAIEEPKILILGGSSKNSDFRTLAQKIIEDKTIKAIILIGQEAKNIRQAIKRAGRFSGKLVSGADNIEAIVAKASKEAKAGDSIILSPACASFDMFKNYLDRGQKFIEAVKKIKA